MGEKNQEPLTWEECIGSKNAFRGENPIGYCTLDQISCPYADKEFLVIAPERRGLLPACYYKQRWLEVIEDVINRWNWVFRAINQVGHDFDFKELISACQTLEEKAELAQLPLEKMINTTYVGVNNRAYGFAFPGDMALDKRKIQCAFGEAGLEIPETKKISLSERYMPNSMTPTTITPFPNDNELELLEGFFVHADENFLWGGDKPVYIGAGGKITLANRLLVEMPYKAIFDILNFVADGKIMAVDFKGFYCQ